VIDLTGLPLAPGDVLLVDRGYETPCWIWQHGKTGGGAKGGYACRRRGKRRVYVHREVAEAVYGPLGRKTVDHKCRQHDCERPDHLEPVSQRVNLRRGERTKLTPERVRELRRRRAAGERPINLASEFGISPVTVAGICNGRTWRDV
jgi:HNH endonuclease